MKNYVALLICAFLLSWISVNAQTENEFHRFEASVYGGIGTPILDQGLSYYASFNPVIRVTEWLGFQADVNHIYAPKLTPFLWGDVMREKVTSINTGIQLRTQPKESNVFFSFSGAVGYTWIRQINENWIVERYRKVSGTAWINMHTNSFVLSLGGADRYVVVRMGYTLKEKPHR